jgi:hypothetical protein
LRIYQEAVNDRSGGNVGAVRRSFGEGG